MSKEVVTGEDSKHVFIKNGADLLTLKQVVSRKFKKNDGEKQKDEKSNQTNEDHIENDGIHFDIDKSSLEPNVETDSDTNHSINISSIYTHDDQEPEDFDVSNKVDVINGINGEKDAQVNTIKCLDIPYCSNDSVDVTKYLQDLDNENAQSEIIQPSSSTYDILSREPLHSNNEFETMMEDYILPLEKEEINLRKRKSVDPLKQEYYSGKVLKLWNILKYPFQTTTVGSSIDEAIISKVEDINDEDEKSILPEMAVNENHGNNLGVTAINPSYGTETNSKIEDTSEMIKNKKYCSIM